MEATYQNETVHSGQLLTGAASASAVISAWYTLYGTDVLRLCYMYMRNRTDAEDAAQETFLKIWRKLDRFEGKNQSSAKSWIMRIACNTCKDLLRKSWRKHEERTLTEEDLASLGSASREDRELVMDVMNLPEKYRSVLLMVYWQGMTMQEAAETLRTSPSTICRRLEKARRMMEC